jgi:hypothetical protein
VKTHAARLIAFVAMTASKKILCASEVESWLDVAVAEAVGKGNVVGSGIAEVGRTVPSRSESKVGIGSSY